jgi:hypothetical protein
MKIEIDKPVVKAITKTKQEDHPDLKKELDMHNAEIAAEIREKERVCKSEAMELKNK